jgi:major intracellular serine protease
MKYIVTKELEIRSKPSISEGESLGILKPGYIIEGIEINENLWLADYNGHYFLREQVKEAILTLSNGFELDINLKAPWLEKNFDISMFWKNTTGENVTIAVMDTGVFPHEDIKDNIVDENNEHLLNYNCVNDMNGHGTHVSGIICANGRNKIIGVAPQAKVLPLKVYNPSNVFDRKTFLTSLNLLHQKEHIKIVNISFSLNYDEEIKIQIENLIKKGKLFVVAAGNNGGNFATFPANIDGVISVGAIKSDQLGQYQLMNNSNFGSSISICAPGHQILSCSNDKQTYNIKNGTSMAAAYISGLLALKIQTLDDNSIPYTPNEVIQSLNSSTFGQAKRWNGKHPMPIVDPRKFLNSNSFLS